MWTGQMAEKPRGSGLLLGAKNQKRSKLATTPGYGKEAQSQTVKTLTEALRTYTHEVRRESFFSFCLGGKKVTSLVLSLLVYAKVTTADTKQNFRFNISIAVQNSNLIR